MFNKKKNCLCLGLLYVRLVEKTQNYFIAIASFEYALVNLLIRCNSVFNYCHNFEANFRVLQEDAVYLRNTCNSYCYIRLLPMRDFSADDAIKIFTDCKTSCSSTDLYILPPTFIDGNIDCEDQSEYLNHHLGRRLKDALRKTVKDTFMYL